LWRRRFRFGFAILHANGILTRHTPLRVCSSRGSNRRWISGRLTSLKTRRSFVVRPHPNDLHSSLFFEDLIDETMLDIDSARICSCEITDELFVRRGSLKRIEFEEFQQSFGFGFKSTGGESLGVFLCLFCEDDCPHYQGSSVEHFSTGVFIPRRIDSRIFGIDSR